MPATRPEWNRPGKPALGHSAPPRSPLWPRSFGRRGGQRRCRLGTFPPRARDVIGIAGKRSATCPSRTTRGSPALAGRHLLCLSVPLHQIAGRYSERRDNAGNGGRRRIGHATPKAAVLGPLTQTADRMLRPRVELAMTPQPDPDCRKRRPLNRARSWSDFAVFATTAPGHANLRLRHARRDTRGTPHPRPCGSSCTP